MGFIANLKKIIGASEDRALLILSTGAHVMLMTGRKVLKNKDFGSVLLVIYKLPALGNMAI